MAAVQSRKRRPGSGAVKDTGQDEKERLQFHVND
jgi:hypothetical protein